jgi:hypothetical protein
MKLVILITSKTDESLDVATAWQHAGAAGVTILEGHGFYRLQKKLTIRDDLPLIPSLAALLEQKEVDTHLLLSVVDDALVDTLSSETIRILGDLTIPGNGIFFALKVDEALGLRTP